MALEVAVVRFPGTNCEFDVAEVVTQLGATPRIVFHDEPTLAVEHDPGRGAELGHDLCDVELAVGPGEAHDRDVECHVRRPHRRSRPR